MGRTLVFLPETASTNDEARRLAESGAPDGTLVIADYQTAGRGRAARRWEAPPGSSLLMSLVFRPALVPQQVQRMTMICGLAIADVLESEYGLEPALKWPNDVLVGGAKVGGILTEVLLDAHRVECVITGIGLNVNLDPAELPGELVMASYKPVPGPWSNRGALAAPQGSVAENRSPLLGPKGRAFTP